MRGILLVLMLSCAFTACKSREVKVDVSEKVIAVAKKYSNHIVRGCDVPSDSINKVLKVNPIPVSDWIKLSETKEDQLLEKIEREKEYARRLDFYAILETLQQELVVARSYGLHLKSLPHDQNEAIAYMLVYKTPGDRICSLFIDEGFRFVADREDLLYMRCMEQFVANVDLEELDQLVEQGLIEVHRE